MRAVNGFTEAALRDRQPGMELQRDGAGFLIKIQLHISEEMKRKWPHSNCHVAVRVSNVPKIRAFAED